MVAAAAADVVAEVTVEDEVEAEEVSVIGADEVEVVVEVVEGSATVVVAAGNSHVLSRCRQKSGRS